MDGDKRRCSSNWEDGPFSNNSVRDDGNLQRLGLSDTLDGGGVEKRDSVSPGFYLG